MFTFQRIVTCMAAFSIIAAVTSPIKANATRNEDASIQRSIPIGIKGDIASAIKPSIPASVGINSIGIKGGITSIPMGINAIEIASIGIKGDIASVIKPSIPASIGINSIGIKGGITSIPTGINAIEIASIGIKGDIASAISQSSIPTGIA
jgi:hypothetical protein